MEQVCLDTKDLVEIIMKWSYYKGGGNHLYRLYKRVVY